MKEYLIKKGNHYSQFELQLHGGITSMEREVKFTESCLYQPINADYKDDINKLFGWSMGYHKSDSVRFGWEPEEDKNNELTGRINIYSYTYSHWVREFKLITAIEINKIYRLRIVLQRINPLEYTFYVYHGDAGPYSPISWKDHKLNDPLMRSGYILKPFHGGDEAAQHDTRIFMSKPIITYI